MGNFCSSCFKGEAESLLTPDAETRRQVKNKQSKHINTAELL